MGKDYYKILGVSKDADEAEIRRQYKKQALKSHPDRNKNDPKANEKFQEISEAFEVLSDKDKRAVFDQYGEEGLKGGPPPGAGGAEGFPGGFGAGGAGGPGGTTFSFTSGGPGGFTPSDPNDIFAHLFGGMGGGMGGMGGMPGMGGGSRRKGRAGGMEDLFGGMGGMPGGMGGMPGGMGGGMQPETEIPQDATKQLPVSLEDLYKGTTKKLKVSKQLLSGKSEERILSIDIKPGWKKGTKVRFAGAGNEVAPGKSQDLVFVIVEKPNARFTRESDDLIVKLPLPLVDALDPPKNATKSLTTLDGRTISVALPQPRSGHTTVQGHRTTRLANEGMPISKTQGTRKGDLVVHWELQWPERLSEQQRRAVRSALGA